MLFLIIEKGMNKKEDCFRISKIRIYAFSNTWKRDEQ